MVGNFVLLWRASGAVYAICDHKTDGLHVAPQILIFNTGMLILMHDFTYLLFKIYHFAPLANAFSNVKPDVGQSEATFRYFVGFCDWKSIPQNILSHFFMLSNRTSRYIHWLSLGDNHIRIGNRTRLYAVSVLDCTPFSFGGSIIPRSHFSGYFYGLGHLAAGSSHNIT